MAEVRRYGPSRVAPQVQGAQPVQDGAAKAMAGFANILGTASDFLRPAVTDIQKRRGEAEYLEQQGGPSWSVVANEAADKGALPPLQGPNRPKIKAPVNPADGSNVAPAMPVATEAPEAPMLAAMMLPGLMGMGDRTPGAKRSEGLSDGYMKTLSSVVMSALGEGWDVRVKSGGQKSRATLQAEAKARGLNALETQQYIQSNRTGSTRHDVHDHGHSETSDFVLLKGGKEVRPGDDKAAYAALFEAAAPYFPGMGHYSWGVHMGGGSEAFWGPSTGSEDADPYFLAAAQRGRASGGRKYGQVRSQTVNFKTAPDGAQIPQSPDFDLVTHNQGTFERRLPFTIRDAAFNEAADRVLGARAQQALFSGASIVAMEAGSDLGALQAGMEQLKSRIMGDLPASMTGLQLDIAERFETTKGVAVRQAVQAIEAKVVAGQTDALNASLSAADEQSQWLALSGASTSEIQDHLVRSQTSLAQFGPREAFEFNGIQYPADDSRAGILSVSDMGAKLNGMGENAAAMMIRGDFERSTAKGAFVSEMRKEIFAGRSPLPPGKALQLLGQLEAGVRAEDARKTAAAREAAATLNKHTTDTINPYVAMTEAGAPIAIPADERAAILSDLGGHPELQRQAEVQFALADAYVATHNMNGSELSGFIDSQRMQLNEAAARGEIDQEGTAIIIALEDKLKKLQAGITADMTGVNHVLDDTLSGRIAEQVDWEAMRTIAAGKPDLLEKVAVAQEVYEQIGNLRDLTAQQRDDALNEVSDQLGGLANIGDAYGREGVFISEVLEHLEKWNDGLSALAGTDAKTFAKAKGIPMAKLDGETVADLGGQVAKRVLDVSLAAEGEGVDSPVPLDATEKAMLKSLLDDEKVPVATRLEFFGALSELPINQAQAVLKSLGGDGMYAVAGSMARLGRSADAEVVLRGLSVDLALPSRADREEAMFTASNGTIEAGYFPAGALEQIAGVAENYARGLAARSGEPVSDVHMQKAYKVAFGMDSATDKGGSYDGQFGPVLLPDNWTPKVFEQAMGAIYKPEFFDVAVIGVPQNDRGQELSNQAFLSSIEFMAPVSGEQYKFYPLDADGRSWRDEDGNPIVIDVARLHALRGRQ